MKLKSKINKYINLSRDNFEPRNKLLLLNERQKKNILYLQSQEDRSVFDFRNLICKLQPRKEKLYAGCSF